MHAVASHSRVSHSKKKLLQVQQTLQTKIATTLHVDPEHVSESIETESAEDVITKARDMDILIEKIKEKMTIANRNQKTQLLTLIPLSYKDIETEFNVTKHMVKRFTIEVHAPLLSYKGIPVAISRDMVLQGSTSEANNLNDGGPQFAEVFVIVWVGAFVVTLNSKLLGGKLSFFQSVCVLGYCLLPPSIALVICRLILIAETQTTTLFLLRFIVTILGFIWATFASVVFLGDSQPLNRKPLAMYPIFLFYFVVSWLIISHSPST
ncbi:Protein YIPF6 [Nymphon striatum]|nr:Protein YIPF6 [Nymphon striatum]